MAAEQACALVAGRPCWILAEERRGTHEQERKKSLSAFHMAEVGGGAPRGGEMASYGEGEKLLVSICVPP